MVDSRSASHVYSDRFRSSGVLSCRTRWSGSMPACRTRQQPTGRCRTFGAVPISWTWPLWTGRRPGSTTKEAAATAAALVPQLEQPWQPVVLRRHSWSTAQRRWRGTQRRGCPPVTLRSSRCPYGRGRWTPFVSQCPLITQTSGLMPIASSRGMAGFRAKITINHVKVFPMLRAGVPGAASASA
jgi:hypothetical protein